MKDNQKKKEFTVILLYPGCWNDAGEPETYTGYAVAGKPYQAIAAVKQKASQANHGNIVPDDFAVIAVYQGILETVSIL